MTKRELDISGRNSHTHKKQAPHTAKMIEVKKALRL
jgi:hypothetical protein